MQDQLNQLRQDDPDTFGRRFVELTLASDQEMKEALIVNGPDDLPIRLMYMPAMNFECNIIVPAVMGEIPMLPADLVSMILDIATTKMGPPFLVAWCAEGYMQVWSDPNAPDVPEERGVLTKRFAGGDPNVRECLMMNAIHRRADNSLRDISVSQPYTYGDGGVIWDEPSWVDSLEPGTYTRGAVVDQLAKAFGSEQN